MLKVEHEYHKCYGFILIFENQLNLCHQCSKFYMMIGNHVKYLIERLRNCINVKHMDAVLILYGIETINRLKKT